MKNKLNENCSIFVALRDVQFSAIKVPVSLVPMNQKKYNNTDEVQGKFLRPPHKRMTLFVVIKFSLKVFVVATL